MTSRPVVVDAAPPPYDRPVVVVVRRESRLNYGDGHAVEFVVRYVFGRRTAIRRQSTHAGRAARDAAEIVREREPLAVWLLDRGWSDTTVLDGGVWRPLGRATAAVNAAYVAWTEPV